MDNKENFEFILFKTIQNVAQITLNHPETLNAMSVELENEIVSALKFCEHDEGIRAVVLTGSGRAFSSGGDIRKMEKKLDLPAGKAWVELGGKVCNAIMTLPKPVIGAINGAAAGGGMGVALSCDFVIASEKAVFIPSFTKIGLIPDTGIHFTLPRLVGYRKAMELILMAKPVKAKEALALGMINSITNAEDLMSEALSVAQQLANVPTLSFGIVKDILRKTFCSDLQQILDLETLGQSSLFLSEDNREGIAAFREKRAPQFIGK